jgi:arginine utilization protein RocB
MFQQKTEEISERAKGLERWNPGSSQYNQLEEEITRARAQVNAEMALKKKEFMLREANIYYTVYNQIVDEVAEFCPRHGLTLVLRFNSETIDPQNTESVRKGVMRDVVYQTGRNITQQILDRINRHVPPNNAGAVSNRNMVPRARQ